MSPGTRGGRSAKPSGRGRSQARRVARRSSLRQALDAVLRDARGLASSAEPTAAEAFASAIVATWHVDPLGDEDTTARIGARFIEHLVTARTPDALALLHALATLADESVAQQARFAARRLRAEGVPEPPWASEIGRPRFTGAWSSTDEYGDQDLVIAGFEYPGRPAHAVVTMFDHNFSGLVRQAWIGREPDRVRDEWAATSGMAIAPIDEQLVADRLANGLRMYDLYLDPPVYEEVPRLAALLRSRLRCLPPSREIEIPDVSARRRSTLVSAFRKSAEADGLADADLVRGFVDFACDYGAGDALRWSPLAIEICLLDWYPRKMTMDDETILSVPDALRRWVRYAAGRKGLSEAALSESLAAIEQFAPQFIQAMHDQAQFGPAKSLFLEMAADGVNVMDEAAIQSWINDSNARRGAESRAGLTRGRAQARTRGPRTPPSSPDRPSSRRG